MLRETLFFEHAPRVQTVAGFKLKIHVFFSQFKQVTVLDSIFSHHNSIRCSEQENEQRHPLPLHEPRGEFKHIQHTKALINVFFQFEPICAAHLLVFHSLNTVNRFKILAGEEKTKDVSSELANSMVNFCVHTLINFVFNLCVLMNAAQ